MDCSEAEFLDSVPDMIPDNVVDIDLSNNIVMESVNNESFINCKHVTKLDLSEVMIPVLWNVMFKHMPNLEIIVLENSIESYNESSFPDDTFAGLQNLKSVSIWESIRNDPLSFDEYVFLLQKLPHKLEELSISIPGGEDSISQPLSKFTKLKKLGIHSYSGRYNTITNDTFKYLENIAIEELTIDAYILKSVEPLAFHHFPELKSLNISGIFLMSVAEFHPALIGLQNTKLEKLQFLSYDIRGDLHSFFTDDIPEMVILNESFCKALDLPYLTHLYLQYARLFRVVENDCFSKLVNLKVLILSFNCFPIYKIGNLNLGMLENLIEIDISHQYDPTFRRSDLHFYSPRNLATLDLSFVLQPSDKAENFTLSIGSSPKYLNFRSNHVRVLTKFRTSETKSGFPIRADFSRNNMISFEGSFDSAILKNNLIVERLILSENHLGEQLGERGDQIFKYFLNLIELDLTLNDIKQLPHSTFDNLRMLEYLNLSKNALLLVTFEISHMRNLKLLDLSKNLLSQFNDKLQNDIDEVKSYSPNFKINMLGNPFVCSCDTLSFLWWMYHRRYMFDRFENYTCTHKSEIKYFERMAELLNAMNTQCSLIFIEVSSGLLAFLIFVIALSVFLYRHKWDARFFCLKYVTNRKAYQEYEESEEEYEYDAFVAFHSNDQDWVWNELHENLGITGHNVKTDNQPRFRLCIHERDFVPGDLIEENILRSIESSRKTIVVLSKNFLQSVWCEFELQIARKLCVDKGRDLIIAVMLEPLPANIKISQSVKSWFAKILTLNGRLTR